MMLDLDDIARCLSRCHPASANLTCQRIWEVCRHRGQVLALRGSTSGEDSTSDDFEIHDINHHGELSGEESRGRQPALEGVGNDEGRETLQESILVLEMPHLSKSLCSHGQHSSMAQFKCRDERTDEPDEASDKYDIASVNQELIEGSFEQPYSTVEKHASNCNQCKVIFTISTTWSTIIRLIFFFPLFFLLIRAHADVFCLIGTMILALILISYLKHKCFKLTGIYENLYNSGISRIDTAPKDLLNEPGVSICSEPQNHMPLLETLLEPKLFKVLDVDGQSSECDSAVDRYRSDLVWISKFSFCTLKSGLNMMDSKVYKLCHQIKPDDIYYLSRGAWWTIRLSSIQNEVLQDWLRLIIRPDLIYRHNYTLLDAIIGLYNCHENAALPPIETWPHRPVFARLILSNREIQNRLRKFCRWHNSEYYRRSNAYLKRKAEVKRQHSKIHNAIFGVEEVHESDFAMDECPINIPESPDLFINTEPGHQSAWSAVKEFETDLFIGRMLLRMAGINTSNQTSYFTGRRRRMQVVFQGSFRRRLPLDAVYTGQVWEKPFNYSLNNLVINVAQKAISNAFPSVKVNFNTDRPYMLLPMVASMQTIIVQKKSETIVDLTDINLEESSAGLDGNVDSSPFWSRHKKKRRRYFSNPLHLQTKYLEPDYVYTFETYQHLFEPSTFSMKVAFYNVNIAQYVKSQPVEINAFVPPFDRSGTPIFDTPPEYVWRCQIAHENQLTT